MLIFLYTKRVTKGQRSSGGIATMEDLQILDGNNVKILLLNTCSCFFCLLCLVTCEKHDADCAVLHFNQMIDYLLTLLPCNTSRHRSRAGLLDNGALSLHGRWCLLQLRSWLRCS
jgi:hypothetical protein